MVRTLAISAQMSDGEARIWMLSSMETSSGGAFHRASIGATAKGRSTMTLT